jgi:hypothetical protein
VSGLIGGAQPEFRLRAADKCHLAEAYRQDVYFDRDGAFTSPWWPGSGFIGERGADVAVIDTHPKWYEFPDVTAGMNTRYGVQGVTRDAYGSPLGGCTMKLFRTSDDSLVATTVSDPVGNYLLSTPYYPDAHYVVMYKTGSPDVTGASVNTLIGA